MTTIVSWRRATALTVGPRSRAPRRKPARNEAVVGKPRSARVPRVVSFPLTMATTQHPLLKRQHRE